MCPKDAKSSILAVKFSHKGDYLAVSFNNEYKQSDEIEEDDPDNPLSKMTSKQSMLDPDQRDSGKRDPSFIYIYASKSSEIVDSAVSADPFLKFQKVMIPLQDLGGAVDVRTKLAVTKMDFSLNDRYIEMCSQIVDKDNNIAID